LINDDDGVCVAGKLGQEMEEREPKSTLNQVLFGFSGDKARANVPVDVTAKGRNENLFLVFDKLLYTSVSYRMH